jgi:hypothetical protein
VLLKGEVRRDDGSRSTEFGTAQRPAYVQLGLFNPDVAGVRRDGLSYGVTYTTPGSPVFVGTVAVQQGAFEQPILLPRNLTFDRKGVRLIAYAWQDTMAAVGSDTSLVFHGTDPNAGSISDTTGPVIAVRLLGNGGGAACTDVVRGILPLQCEIVVMDPSGIDILGTGPDEGLTIEVPGVLSRRTINHTFQFREGEYREGIAPFRLEEGDVQPGTYTLNITARDLLGNLSTLSVRLDVIEQGEVALNQAFSYPNPMRMGDGARFYYQAPYYVTDNAPQVVLKIFTMSGKLLRTVQQLSNGWAWDGTDQFGNKLGPNVYLWQMSIAGAGDDEDVRSPIRKLVIHPRR